LMVVPAASTALTWAMREPGAMDSDMVTSGSLRARRARRDSPSPASGRKPTPLPLEDPHGNGHGWLLGVSSSPRYRSTGIRGASSVRR
jgi:hypothetical protein